MCAAKSQVSKKTALRAGNRRRKSSRRKSAPRAEPGGERRVPEVAGIVGLGLATFVLLGLLSLQLGDGSLLGPVGRAFAVGAYALFGIGAYAVGAALALVSIRFLLGRRPLAQPHQVGGAALGLLSLAVLLELVAGDYRVASFGPGGLFGSALAEHFRDIVSTVGTALIAVVGLVVAAVVATPLRMSQVLGGSGRALHRVGRRDRLGHGRGARCRWRVRRRGRPRHPPRARSRRISRRLRRLRGRG